MQSSVPCVNIVMLVTRAHLLAALRFVVALSVTSAFALIGQIKEPGRWASHGFALAPGSAPLFVVPEEPQPQPSGQTEPLEESEVPSSQEAASIKLTGMARRRPEGPEAPVSLGFERAHMRAAPDVKLVPSATLTFARPLSSRVHLDLQRFLL